MTQFGGLTVEQALALPRRAGARMSSVTATLRDDRIEIQSPFALKDRIKAIPGSRWEAARKRWSIPATPAAAASIVPFLSPRQEIDPGLRSLLVAAEEVQLAQRFKDKGLALDPLPFEPVTRPWRHQLAAYHFASRLTGCLFYMGMGTGKTRCVLDLIQGRGDQLVLVVCPLSVAPAWAKQAALHAPGVRVVVLDKGGVEAKRKQAELELSRSERPLILVTNYDSAWRAPFGDWALAQSWDLVVADECHRIKAAGSRVSTYFAQLAGAAKRRLGLSGTPLAHSPLDAYGVFRFLDAGIFGTSFARFRWRYAAMGGYENRQVVEWINREEFAERFYSITYRADRDVLELPDAQHVERTFALPPAAARVYRELRDEFVSEVAGGLVTATNALSRLLRLQQITSGHLPVEHLDSDEGRSVERLHGEKRRLLAETLEELDPAEPVVVFCRFIEDLADVHAAATAAGRTSSELSGRRRELAQWQAGETVVLAVQIQSGGEGVDLTRAAYCVYLSLGYSLAQYEQSLARVHRPGQGRSVVYVHLIAEGTVDRAVYRALRAKKQVIESILEERSL